MKEIVILSGKGGTGKTTITGAFAALATPVVLADCDVDAADLHLILSPEGTDSHPFYGGKRARIDPALCDECGNCLELCRFEAIRSSQAGYRIDDAFCEGCGVCARFCPREAIVMREKLSGEWYHSRTRFGTMLHAKLAPAEENSGKLVSAVRSQARLAAEAEGIGTILIDGPPGTGCPAIAALTGADVIVLVTEPTKSAYHDLRRVSELAGHFQIPQAVVINKNDLNPRISKEIAEFAAREDIPVIGSLPYDAAPTEAQMQGKTVMELPGNEFTWRLEDAWRNLTELLTRREAALAILRN